MDNYKIKVKDEAVSKEAQELFFELGYKLYEPGRARLHKVNWISSFDDGEICLDANDVTDHKELTIPQLRDLVVLKRGDVRDATHTCHEGWKWYVGEDTYWFISMNGGSTCWQKRSVNLESLKPIQKPQPKEEGLISGADAMVAAIEGKDVEYEWVEGSGNWRSFSDEEWSAEDLKSSGYRFRFKPTTLTVNAELPKPHKETQQNTEVYAVTYEFKTREERNAFADKLRGTNS